jgi:hypothetical protein
MGCPQPLSERRYAEASPMWLSSESVCVRAFVCLLSCVSVCIYIYMRVYNIYDVAV